MKKIVLPIVVPALVGFKRLCRTDLPMRMVKKQFLNLQRPWND